MNKNVGYHAGDLGKSEYYYQQSGGRGTGHFGTGTYFVGDPKEIQHYNERDGKPAPKHIVDFTPYKLYKPNNENTASDLHSALKLLNDYKSYMETDEIFDKIIDEYKYLKKYFDIDYNRYSPRWTRADILRGWENNKYTIIDYINDLIDYYNASQDVKYLNPEHMGNISYDPEDEYFEEVLEGALKTLVNELRLEDHIENKEVVSDENLIRKFYMFPKDDVIYALEKVVEAQNFAKSQGGWYGSFGKKWDSLSTVFMKALGYEGVDVRHLPRFDNTTYGSVIYNLKPETILESLNEKIVKKGSKWQVQSEKGHNMGTYDNKEDAEKRLQQIHYFKHVNEKLDTDTLESQIRDILAIKDGVYTAEDHPEPHLFEVGEQKPGDNPWWIKEFDDDTVDFGNLKVYDRSPEELEEGKYVATFMITGGRNGSGNWVEYLNELQQCFERLQEETGCEPLLYKIDTDICDDLWTGFVFMYSNPKETIEECYHKLLTEGCWGMPQTIEQVSKLKDLMSKPVDAYSVGDHVENKNDDLGIGDDELFDRISRYRKEHSYGSKGIKDVRKVIQKFIKDEVLPNWNNYGYSPNNDKYGQKYFEDGVKEIFQQIANMKLEEGLNESKQDRINLENKVGRELSDKFFELRDRLSPPQNDVYYWINKKPSELENTLNSIEKSRKQKDMEAREGTDLIFEDDTWLVLKINTHEASKKYGKGTKWCISGEGDWKSRTAKYHNSKEVWDDYVNNHGANIWFFINKKDNHKYCVVECAITLDGQTATGLEIYDDSNKMIVEIPNAPRTEVPTYSEITSQLFQVLSRFVDTDKIVNLISYDPDQAMTHQDIRVDLDGEEGRYFRFDRYGRVQEITKNDLEVIDESYESSDFKLGTAGYIKEDGTFIYVDEYHGEDEELSKKHYPEFSNTHPEEDTCIRLELDYEPNEIQFKKLEEIINKYLDIEDYCKIEIWDGTPAFYRIYSIFEGACEDTDWNEKVGNWSGYKLVSIIKNFYSNSMKESLLEKLLLEKTRSELIAKSKKSDKYKSKDREGENRWTRRTKSRIATKVADYNKIDMDAFFRGDILDFVVAVQGETNNYEVLVTFEDILNELQNQIKSNKNKLEFKCVLRALINQFNKGSVYVSCSCPDWTYRQAYWSTKGQYNSGAPQPSNGKMIANPGDTKGAGCKHVNLVLANLDWIMKIASVINNYIYWARDNMEYQYGKLIFPKLFGMPYDKAIQLTLDMYDEDGNLKPEYTQNKLRSDLDTINMSNMIGAKRTQYKKKPEISVNPRYEPPKKEEPEENELGLEFGEDKELVTDEETED